MKFENSSSGKTNLNNITAKIKTLDNKLQNSYAARNRKDMINLIQDEKFQHYSNRIILQQIKALEKIVDKKVDFRKQVDSRASSSFTSLKNGKNDATARSNKLKKNFSSGDFVRDHSGLKQNSSDHQLKPSYSAKYQAQIKKDVHPLEKNRSEASGRSRISQSQTHHNVLHKLKQIIQVASNEILNEPIKQQKSSVSNNLDKNLTMKQARTVLRNGNKKSNSVGSTSTPNLTERTKTDISRLYLSQTKNSSQNRKANLKQNLSDVNLKNDSDSKKKNVTFLVNPKISNQNEMGDCKQSEGDNIECSIEEKVQQIVVENVVEIEKIDSDKKIEENEDLEDDSGCDLQIVRQPSLNQEGEMESISVTLDSQPICELTPDRSPIGQFGSMEIIKKDLMNFSSRNCSVTIDQETFKILNSIFRMNESSDYKKMSEYKQLIIQNDLLEIIPRSRSVTEIDLKSNWQRDFKNSNLNVFVSSLNEKGEMSHHAFIPLFIRKCNNSDVEQEDVNFAIHICFERSIALDKISDSDLFWVEDKNTNTELNFLNYFSDVTSDDVLTIYDSNELKIGQNCSVTSRDLICNADHRQDDSKRYFFRNCLQHIWSEDYFYDKYLRVLHDAPNQNISKTTSLDIASKNLKGSAEKVNPKNVGKRQSRLSISYKRLITKSKSHLIKRQTQRRQQFAKNFMLDYKTSVDKTRIPRRNVLQFINGAIFILVCLLILRDLLSFFYLLINY